MNAFYEHHKDSIEFGYRCFDRLLLNGLIQPFQQPERVLLDRRARRLNDVARLPRTLSRISTCSSAYTRASRSRDCIGSSMSRCSTSRTIRKKP